MDVLSNNNDTSSYINDFDVVPPSPPLLNRDLDAHQSPYIQDYNFSSSIGSPSFNGSHHSPFSGHSELSFGGDDISFGIFDDEQTTGLGLSQGYDPTDYDPPSTGQSLLIFNDGDYMPQYTTFPRSTEQRGNAPYDYSSPSSNASGNDDQPDKRSRASSVSSNRGISYSPSPRLDVAQSFENMTFHSPNWGTEPLPQLPRSPAQKQTSPPRLLMPDNYQDSQAPPKINAPEGDGNLGGPQFNIVPATPVSGAVGQSDPFQQSLNTIHHGSTLGLPSQRWSGGVDQGSVTDTAQSSKTVPSDQEFTFPPQTGRHDNTNASAASSSRTGQILDDSAVGNSSSYLFPPTQKSRSKSDTNRELPTWDQAFIQQQQQQMHGNAISDDATVNMNDVLPGNQQQSQLNQAFTFGASKPNHNFLSPDQIRRVKSDTGPRSAHHRQSRSEDVRSNLLLPSNPGHQHSQSSSGQFLFPPQPGQYLTPDQTYYNNSTGSLDGPLPPISSLGPGQPGRSLISSPGHMRRASSGTRSERGAEAWTGGAGPPVLSNRISPYPSPHASPHPRYNDLPYDDTPVQIGLNFVGANISSGAGLLGVDGYSGVQQPQRYGTGYTFPGSYTPSSTGASAYHTPGQSPSPGPPLPMDVPKPNVTTGRTANASHKRRKQEATFVCPVAGCGSTFTRSFNLKGHIRSHNEEKPFQCHWPGCGKGFARQHDCKRHEQLHTNYRPFNCEGCGKQFARMDALNRHLRSEGGADCMKLQDNEDGSEQGSGMDGVSVKMEEKKSWVAL